MELNLLGVLISSPAMWVVSGILMVSVLLCNKRNEERRECQQIDSDSGMTGETLAGMLLKLEGLQDVQVQCMDFKQGDHYNSFEKTIYLSADTFYGGTIYALASAAHQCGHAKQHQEDYSSMKVRSILVSILSVISFLGLLLFFAGIWNDCDKATIQLALIMLVAVIVFQLLSLPMEFNASKRAMMTLGQNELLPSYEWKYLDKALHAAALTYLASNALTAGVILRFFSHG